MHRLKKKLFMNTAGPNTALIKSSGRKDVSVIIGGRMSTIPIIDRLDTLNLQLRTITVRTVRGTTINGVSVDVTSYCQVKIQGWSMTPSDATDVDKKSRMNRDIELRMDHMPIRLAAQHFIDKKDHEINDAIQKTISGHQRAIIGVLTVEQLYRDRATFSKRVLDLCYDDMRNMGLTVVSYTVAEITDENGYILALGVTQTELVKRQAVEGAAREQAQATIFSAREEAAAHLCVNAEEVKKIESDKCRSIAKAEAQRTIDRSVAFQEKEHEIAAAEQDAVLLVTCQKAKAAEVEAELNVMLQKVAKEKLLKEQQVHVDADACLYRATIEAQGIAKSTAAEADRIRLLGEANAAAVRAKGLAEIQILRNRVQVWNECGNQAALLEKMIEILPKVAAAISAPLSKTEKMVFVGSGSSGGPSQLTRQVERIVAEVPETVNALTGFDLRKGMANLMHGQNDQGMIGGFTEGLSSSMTQQAMDK